MLTIDNGVATLTLDRPDAGNALSAQFVEHLIDSLARAQADASAHTLVLRAQGRHFCTGFDLGALDSESDADLLARFVRIEMLLDALWRAPMRTVALAQGRAIGAGADLFACCDIRLIAPQASLRFPGAGFGIVLGTRRLATRVGASQALRWVSEGATVDAQAAVDAGLATGMLDTGASNELSFDSPPLSVERATYASLRAALLDRDADRDLAALVRSAAVPGLKARIVAYRDQVGAAARRDRPKPSPGADRG